MENVDYDFTDMPTVDDPVENAIATAPFNTTEKRQKNKNKQQRDQRDKTPRPPLATPASTPVQPVRERDVPSSPSSEARETSDAGAITPIDAVADIMDVLPEYFNHAARLGKDITAIIPIKPLLAGLIVAGAAMLACSLDSRRQE